MLCKKKNNRIEGVPVYCKKSSLHLSGRNNKIIFGKNCNIVNCRIKLYGNSTLVLGDDCYFENTLIMLRDSEARFGNNTEASKVTVTSTGNSLLDLGAGSVICGEFDMRNQGIIRAKRLWTTWGPHIAANHGLIEFGDGSIISSGTYTGKEIPPHSLVAGNPGRIVRRDVVWAVKDKPELKELFPLSADDEDGMRAFYERAYEVTPTIKHRKGCRLLNRLRVFWALFSAK